MGGNVFIKFLYVYVYSCIILFYYVSLLLLLSVYSPFSDRVGLPLHNIPSPFLSIMDIFFVDLKFGHIRFYTL